MRLKQDRENLADCFAYEGLRSSVTGNATVTVTNNATETIVNGLRVPVLMEACMTEGDYRLFSYYWLFRLETVIVTASFCTVFAYAIIKLIMSRSHIRQAFNSWTMSQQNSDDLLIRASRTLRGL